MSRIISLPAVLLFTCTCNYLAPGDESAGSRGTASEVQNTRVQSNSVRPIPTVAAMQGQNSTAFAVSNQLHGVAKPSNSADLPSLVPGIITVVHVPEGKFVKKGDALVTLDDRVPRARLQAATIEAHLTGALQRTEVELRMAESRLERIRRVLNQGAGASFELLEAEGTRDQAAAAVAQQNDILKAAEANRELAEAQLHQYTITAPFDGLVTEIHIKSGAVDPSQIVISIANLTVLEVELHAPSQLFGRIGRGDRLNLQASEPVSGVIAAAVVSVSPIINSASNTFRCLLQIDNSRGTLPAGFTVTLQDTFSNNGAGTVTLAE